MMRFCTIIASNVLNAYLIFYSTIPGLIKYEFKPMVFQCLNYSTQIQVSPSVTEWPGRVAQSVGHLTRKSGVLGSIPGLTTYFRFSFRFFKKGSCQLLASTKYWLTA